MHVSAGITVGVKALGKPHVQNMTGVGENK